LPFTASRKSEGFVCQTELKISKTIFGSRFRVKSKIGAGVTFDERNLNAKGQRK
jgi:hypothetical protein